MLKREAEDMQECREMAMARSTDRLVSVSPLSMVCLAALGSEDQHGVLSPCILKRYDCANASISQRSYYLLERKSSAEAGLLFYRYFYLVLRAVPQMKLGSTKKPSTRPDFLAYETPLESRCLRNYNDHESDLLGHGRV